MKPSQSPRMTKKSGQGMTEYIVIVALVAIAAIAVYQFFGQTVRAQTSAIALELAGQSAAAKTSIGVAKTAAEGTTGDQLKKKGLDAFDNSATAAN